MAPAPERKMPPSLARLSQDPKQGKVSVQVYLADLTEATLAKLKQAGFEITATPKGGTIVTGRIAASGLRKLAELAEVRYIAPVV